MSAQPSPDSAASRDVSTLFQLADHLNDVARSAPSMPVGRDAGQADTVLARRWRDLFQRELNDVQVVVSRLRQSPGSVANAEVTQAIDWARELERLYFADRLQAFRGHWVAVIGNEVIAASKSRPAVIKQLPHGSPKLPLVFLVGADDKIEA